MSKEFTEWLNREMPAGTVISDPEWWVPRILKAARTTSAEPVAYVLFKDGEVHFDADDGAVISNVRGDELDESHKWLPVYTAPDALQAEVERLKRVEHELRTALKVSNAHTKLLKAENERNRSLSVEKILIDVVPGDGEGLEVFAKSVKDVEQSISKLIAESETWELKHRDAEAENERLREEVERLKADAERYRWIRSRLRTSDSDSFGIYIGVDSERFLNRWALSEEEADAAIDAARTAKPEVDHE